MAHFAQLDNNNVVVNVVVVDNEHELQGEFYCEMLFGGRWKQTSYNGRIRKKFAAIGDLYNEKLDMFVAPQPKPWYELDDNGNWHSPLGVHPDTGEYLQDWQWKWLELVFAVNVDWGMNIG